MTSRKPPVVGTFIDEDQRHLAEAIERDGYDPGANLLTPERLAAFQAGARATINETRVKIFRFDCPSPICFA